MKKTNNITKSSKGITLIALVITIIIMLILAAITLNYGTGEVEKAKLEDLKITMLLIQGRAKIVIDKEQFKEEYNNEGMIKVSDATEYDMSNLQNLDTTNLYIWEQEAMDNNDIDVEITTEDFFVIDYQTGEVYYSLGYNDGENTYYSLTDIQSL